MEDNIRGGDEAVEVDEDGATTTGECWECGGEPAAPLWPASVDDGRCLRSPASSEWGEHLERDDNLHASCRDSGSGNGEDTDGSANVDLKEFVASTRSQLI